jgi:F420-dependent NADP oxidoreductase-like protein
MRIAIIGAGNVGSALGRGWSAAGEDLFSGYPILPIPNTARCLGRGCAHPRRRRGMRKLSCWRRPGPQLKQP